MPPQLSCVAASLKGLSRIVANSSSFWSTSRLCVGSHHQQSVAVVENLRDVQPSMAWHYPEQAEPLSSEHPLGYPSLAKNGSARKSGRAFKRQTTRNKVCQPRASGLEVVKGAFCIGYRSRCEQTWTASRSTPISRAEQRHNRSGQRAQLHIFWQPPTFVGSWELFPASVGSADRGCHLGLLM
jgi:hypothetical protein